jgi:hypothetical protein
VVSILLIFLDGVGLGPNDPATNPFARVPTPALRALLGGPLVMQEPLEREDVLLRAADATLGVPGLPQSATGQTALLTGVNAPAQAGRHVTAYPTEPLRALLAGGSLFARLVAAGARVALANVYSPEYFEAVAARRLKVAAVTFAAQAAGVRLRTLDDLRAGQAVFHDLTNRRLRQWGYDLPEQTPHEAGRRLAAIGEAADFTFFEFFLTDLAAHDRVPMTVDEAVATVDALIAGVVERRAPALSVLITSDHGNIEDDRTGLHTTNPVPVLVVGPARAAFRQVRAITDLAPAVIAAVLGDEAAPAAGAAGGPG